MALFVSDNWAFALKTEINNDREIPSAGKGFNAVIQFVVNNAGPRGDLPFWMEVKNGRVTSLAPGEKDKYDFSVTGGYGVWKDISLGNMDALQALMAKKLSFEGNKTTATKYVKALSLMMDALTRVSTEFE
ncbi:MAG: SCP2 sterol-binding domain-containing protein [Actinobacteria bacterium]|nr:SCP2 sterol-binding domain-containing protein [Actinomycetota bacterium]